MALQVLSDTAPALGGGQRGFGWFARALVGYLLAVIVFGAWVRVTGSGAGCGDHWPTCHGELVPRTPSEQTLIEYTHRLTSGLLGVIALALPLWAMRCFAPGHPVRRWSWATLALIGVEGAIGAGLVVKGLVADNASAARALVVALHLGNTLLLTTAATLTAARARSSVPARQVAGAGARPWLLALLSGLLVVACTGAVTALGDTLFPVHGGVRPPSEHFLVRLRIVHPVLACLVIALGLRVAALAWSCRPARLWAASVGALSAVQLLLGLANIALHAPGTLQLLHLLVAQLLWMGTVMLREDWRAAEPAR